ncbi:DMT family transporter [Janthinobacterium sp. 17J80-10]|uniref:DMT family transporter n=1 Tax=Janthinobacterium sp. 17J80-10 TaxID=2497863 RepID=UPI001005703C|nr:DMT family transporter [Janthinobacterium sp. 17J80-10]QAU33046.1 DMT family transporter [Janthinobacterium sp. 17J80-10]
MSASGIYVRLVLVALFWASVFQIGKYAVEVVSPLFAASWRFMIAAAVLVPIIAMREGWSLSALRRSAFGLLVMSAIGVFGFNVSLFYGLRMTSAVNGALIMGFTPALTAVLSTLVNRESLSRQQVVGMALGIAGVVVVVSKGSWHALAAMSLSTGDLLVMVGSLCFAIYPIIPKRFVHGMSALQTTGASIAGGAALMAAFAMMAAPDFLTPPPLPIAAGIAFMGLFGSAVAYLWWNQAVQHMGATSVAVFLNLVPIFTALIGVVLGQSISIAQVCGAGLVITGVLYSSGKLAFFRRPQSWARLDTKHPAATQVK